MYVGFHDDGKLFHLALGNLAEQVIQSDLLIGFKLLFLLFLTALLHQFPSEALVFDGVKDVASGGDFRHTGDFNGDGGACFGDYLTSVVDHLTDTTHRGSGNEHISGVKGTVLDKQSSDRATALVKPRFDNGSLGKTVGVGF